MKRIKLKNTREIGAGNESKPLQKKTLGWFGNGETKHFVRIALIEQFHECLHGVLSTQAHIESEYFGCTVNRQYQERFYQLYVNQSLNHRPSQSEKNSILFFFFTFSSETFVNVIISVVN